MPANPQIPTGVTFAWRLAIFYAALCIALGVQMLFLPVWFVAKGMDASSVGIALAIPLLVRLIAIPIASDLADRYDVLRAVIITGAVSSVLAYAGVGLMNATGAIMAAVALASAFYTPLMTLADAYALHGLPSHGRGYGPVRLWGSAAFIVGTIGGGVLLDVVAAEDLVWLVVAALGLNAAAAGMLSPLHNERSGPKGERARATLLLRNRGFLAIAAAAAMIQASHAVYYGFSALQWQAAGLTGATIGVLWAIGVIAEIVLFAASAGRPFDPVILLAAGAGGALIRWGAMVFDPSLPVLTVLQCLHAFSFGATHLGAVAFVARAAPAGLGASVQGYLAVALALAMAVAMGVSGELYADFGSGAYAAMALLAAFGGLCLLARK
jgi:PPP family 3-phenylpropionic acid transporter